MTSLPRIGSMPSGRSRSGTGSSGAAAGSGAAPSSWVGQERIEFDEPSAGAGDSGWTVGYLDVLLLLVTLFAALLGATYLQLDELRANASSGPVPTAVPSPDGRHAVPASDPPPNAVVEAEVLGQGPGAGKVPVARTATVGSTRPFAGATLNEATAGQGNAVAPQGFAMPREFEPLAHLVAAHHEQQAIEILFDHHQLRLEVGNDILFASGTANLSAAGAELLLGLSAALLDERLQISVEGHTDDVPIATAQFPSNWELSSMRATTVARHLIALGVPEQRLRVTGHADTRPRVRNDSGANRALNRRVSLVLEIAGGPAATRTPSP